MTERQMKILGAVVEEYAGTCEPVSSNSVVSKHAVHVSSATVRNEMAELEAAGYLRRPHTSSGCVPTDAGYRCYVNALLAHKPTGKPGFETRHITEELNRSFTDFDALLRQAALSLADFTGYAALALSPEAEHLLIEQIHCLELRPQRCVLLLALSGGVLRDRQIRLTEALTPRLLERLNRMLKLDYLGRRLSALQGGPLYRLVLEAGIPYTMADSLVEGLLSIAEEALEYVLYLEGLTNLFRQPEFQAAEKTVALLDFFRSTEEMTEYLAQGIARPEDFFVRIGSDLVPLELQDCTLLGMRYEIDTGSRGYLAILGPRRMAYSEVILRAAFVKQLFNTILDDYVPGGI